MDSRLQLVLERLATLSPRDLVHEAKKIPGHIIEGKQHSYSGGGIVASLIDECVKWGLLPALEDIETSTDIQRLHLLFDVALENNMASLVCNYVTELCLDEAAVSSDAVTATLLDGEVILQWCGERFSSLCTQLQALCTNNISKLGESLDLCRVASGRLAGMILVLETLRGGVDEDDLEPNATESGQLLEAMRVREQHVLILEWCFRHRCLKDMASKYDSLDHWRAAFQRRQDAAEQRAWPPCGLESEGAQSVLFVEEALSCLFAEEHPESYETAGTLPWTDMEQPDASMSYPPASLWGACEQLFLRGSASAFIAKKAIFLYYLLDQFWNHHDNRWRSVIDDYVRTFGMSRTCMVESFAFCLLDDDSNDALQEACKLLPEIAGPGLHPRVAQVLLERGEPDLALAMLRGSSFHCGSRAAQNGDMAPLEDAVTAVRVLMECGLLTEAYLYQREHCDGLQARGKGIVEAAAAEAGMKWEAHADVLVGEICHLCIRRGWVERMIELPWNVAESHVVHRCLLARAAEEPSGTAGSLLVVFFMQRSNHAEAMAVHQQLLDIEQRFEQESRDPTKVARLQLARSHRSTIVDAFMALLPSIQQRHIGKLHQKVHRNLPQKPVQGPSTVGRTKPAAAEAAGSAYKSPLFQGSSEAAPPSQAGNQLEAHSPRRSFGHSHGEQHELRGQAQQQQEQEEMALSPASPQHSPLFADLSSPARRPTGQSATPSPAPPPDSPVAQRILYFEGISASAPKIGRPSHNGLVAKDNFPLADQHAKILPDPERAEAGQGIARDEPGNLGFEKPVPSPPSEAFQGTGTAGQGAEMRQVWPASGNGDIPGVEGTGAGSLLQDGSPSRREFGGDWVETPHLPRKKGQYERSSGAKRRMQDGMGLQAGRAHDNEEGRQGSENHGHHNGRGGALWRHGNAQRGNARGPSSSGQIPAGLRKQSLTPVHFGNRQLHVGSSIPPGASPNTSDNGWTGAAPRETAGAYDKGLLASQMRDVPDSASMRWRVEDDGMEIDDVGTASGKGKGHRRKRPVGYNKFH